MEVDDLVHNLAAKYDLIGVEEDVSEAQNATTFLERFTELRDQKVADIENMEVGPANLSPWSLD